VPPTVAVWAVAASAVTARPLAPPLSPLCCRCSPTSSPRSCSSTNISSSRRCASATRCGGTRRSRRWLWSLSSPRCCPNAEPDSGRPLMTQNRATVGLVALGGVIFERFLLPHVAAMHRCWKRNWQPRPPMCRQPHPLREDAVRVSGATLSEVLEYMRRGGCGRGGGRDDGGRRPAAPFGADANADGEDEPGAAAPACWPALRRRMAGTGDARALGETAVVAAVPGYTAARVERLLSCYGEDRLFPFLEAPLLHRRLEAEAGASRRPPRGDAARLDGGPFCGGGARSRRGRRRCGNGVRAGEKWRGLADAFTFVASEILLNSPCKRQENIPGALPLCKRQANDAGATRTPLPCGTRTFRCSP